MFQICFNKYRDQMEAYLSDKMSRNYTSVQSQVVWD